MTLRRTNASSSTSLLSRAVEISSDRYLVLFSAQMPPVVDAAADPRSVQAFGDTHQQTLGCLARVKEVLQESGLALEDLVHARVYLVADPRSGQMDFDGFNTAWSSFFGEHATAYPARTVLQAAGLVNPGWLLEIEPTAARVQS